MESLASCFFIISKKETDRNGYVAEGIPALAALKKGEGLKAYVSSPAFAG